MSNVCIINVEGVLSAPTEELPNALPIVAGIDFYKALSITYTSLVVVSRAHKHSVNDWFDQYGLAQPWWVVFSPEDGSKIGAVQDAIGRLRVKPSFYIDSDPMVVAYMAAHGIPSLQFCHPRETMIDWSTRSRSSWQQPEVAEEEATA